MDTEEKTYLELEQIFEQDHEVLLTDLKEKAWYVEISKRKEFEHHLLRLAQEINDYEKRNALYEVLVSLQSIWNKYQPEKGLGEKFRAAFDGGNYNEAEENYKKLSKQGLDYIGTFQAGEGDIIPLVTEEDYMLLQYNKKELTFYTLQFEPLAKIPMPESLGIIHVHIPFIRHSSEGDATVKTEDCVREIWLLLEDRGNKKAVVSIDIENLDSIKLDHHFMEQQAIYPDKKIAKDVYRLSCFQNKLLLVAKNSIHYYGEDGKWAEWYNTEKSKNEITAVENIGEGFWIGHSNGDVIILKNLQYVGIRDVFKGFSGAIKNIRRTGMFVLIYSKNCLRISEYTANPVSKPFEAQCEIIHSTILNDNLLLLLANGMLIARQVNQGNIRWQMNLGNNYGMIFALKEYVFCGKRDGENMVFEVPNSHTMAKELESKNVYVEDISFEMDPNAPVRYISDFIGRRKILNEIKEKPNAHFLLFGEPRVGKTSLLNVLRDTLSEKAKCCIVDMTQLLENVSSYEIFEKKFMEKCLGQHFMKISDLPEQNGYHYQVMRSMIDRIKGKKTFCVFGMDNFSIPTHLDEKNSKEFRSFLRSIFVHPGTRLIITCSSRDKNDIKTYFEAFKDILGQRKLLYWGIPLFSEMEVKNALRKKISLQQSVVDDIYKYIGRFPHLIHLYDRWKPGHFSIEKQSKEIGQTFSENIFEYFRNLSLDANLLIATCLYEKMISEKIGYPKFYEKFPFLRNSLSKRKLEQVIGEINHYGSGLSAKKEPEGFKIFLSDNAQLFYNAANNIQWIKDFKILYEFTSLPNQSRANNVAHTFTRITQSSLESNELLKQKTGKHRDKFYVSKLSEKGLKILKMPLTTFIVIPLKPWRKELYEDAFNGLNIEFQEFSRKAGESTHESASQIFYILLFDLHGVPEENIKKDLEGFERISIIDGAMMKNIILAESPKDMASQYIFDQLSIRERSPYTTAGVVPDSLFFGRQMEIALIRGLPENIGIFGTRTIGKTSLLRRLHKAFQFQKQWKVYDMDCSRIESEETLLKSLAEKMSIPFDWISDMEKFRIHITKEAETGGYRYLFLLDEVDRLIQYDTHHDEKIFNTFNRLCNETMKGTNESAARFILFGFQHMFEQMKNPLSRLYNFMVFLPLQALDPEGAMGLVTRPIENIRVQWNNKEEDAKYLVNSCSRHPRLLQAACHALLTLQDSKGDKRDIIERIDVDRALTSPDFREICMRLYRDHDEIDSDEKKKVETKKTLFARISGKDTERTTHESSTPKTFLGDLHRITILAAIRLLFEENKEVFTITDIQNELKNYKIDVSPNVMRNILDRLCLSGNFRLRDESTIVAKEGIRVMEKADKINYDKLEVTQPQIYVGSDTTFPKFSYEFGVRIFPKLLVAHFGGLEKCQEEREKLIKKEDWKEWLRR